MGSVDYLPLYQVPILAPSSPLVGCPQGSFSYCSVTSYLGLPQWLSGKESACNAGDTVLIPGSGRSPRRRKWQPTPVFLPGKKNPMDGFEPWVGKTAGEGKGYPFQYSGLENSVDCIVHGVAKSQTWLSNCHSTSLQRYRYII